MTHKKEAGVGLVELLVVLTVVLVIFAMSMPAVSGYLRVQQEKQAITALREIARAESWYQAQYSNGYIVPGLLMTGTAVTRTCDFPQMLYPAFGGNTVGGYTVTVTMVGTVPQAAGCTNIGALSYFVTATPTIPGSIVGNRGFYIDASAVLKYQDNGVAGHSSPVWMQ